MKVYEVYLKNKQITKEDWNSFFSSVSSYGLGRSHFYIKFLRHINIIRIFIFSKKDIHDITSKNPNIILKYHGEAPDHYSSKFKSKYKLMSNFVVGGNFIDFIEKYQFQKKAQVTEIEFMVTVWFGKIVKVTTLLHVNDHNKMKTFKGYGLNLPLHIMEMDFNTENKFKCLTIPKYIGIEKTINIMSSSPTNPLLSIDTFPYLNNQYYLPLSNFAFDKHTLILGQSGSGKSKFIELFIDRVLRFPNKEEYSLVLIDPHNVMYSSLGSMPNTKVIDFKNYSSDLFPSQSDPVSATAISIELFQDLIAGNYTARTIRVLRYTIYVLYMVSEMSIKNMKKFLTDTPYREGLIKRAEPKGLPENIMLFFDTEFQEIKNKYYAESIAPIIGLIEENELLPAIMREADYRMDDMLANNFLTIFSLDKVSMGGNVVKTIAGLLIQHIFLLAQSREIDKKIILIIDEVSVVQNPTLSAILSEARKYNLYLFMSQQYFSQIDQELREAIFTNIYNYFVFKISNTDAKLIEGSIAIDIPSEIMEVEKKTSGAKESEIKIKIMTEDLQSREVLARIYADGKFYPAIKGKTLDIPMWPEYKMIKPSDHKKASAPEATTNSVKNDKIDIRVRSKSNNPIDLMRLFSSSQDGEK